VQKGDKKENKLQRV